MNPFSARVSCVFVYVDFNLLTSKWVRPFALTSSLTKNLIRSGLKFNHSLKELILGAIGGWCPLHLIVAQLLLLLLRLSGFAVSSDYTRLRFFFPFPLLSFFFSFFFFPLLLHPLRALGTFSFYDRPSPGNNLLCINIKPCYLIEMLLPSSSLSSSFRLELHEWQYFLAWVESKGFACRTILLSNFLSTDRADTCKKRQKKNEWIYFTDS